MLLLILLFCQLRAKNWTCLQGNSSEYLRRANVSCRCPFAYDGRMACCVITKIITEPTILGFRPTSGEMFANYGIYITVSDNFDRDRPFGTGSISLYRSFKYFEDDYCKALMALARCESRMSNETLAELHKNCPDYIQNRIVISPPDHWKRLGIGVIFTIATAILMLVLCMVRYRSKSMKN